MPPRWLAPAARYLHSWIVSKRCLGVVAGFQRLLGVREERTGRSGAEGHHYRCVWPVHAYFKVASILGSELFYIVFLPIVIWQVDWQLGRSAIIFWNILFYIGNLMKDLLCLPRPLNPPVLCLEQEYSAEYGLPSVHALGTFVPLYCLLKAVPSTASTTAAAAAVSSLAEWRAHPYWRAWLLFSTSVCASRLYLGVHSLPDLVAGLLLGGLLLAFGIGLGDVTERFAIQNPWGGVVLCLASLLMVLVYPKPDRPTPTLGYTVSVMGAGGGVLLASRHLLAAAPTSKPAATTLATLTQPPPFSTQVLLRIVVGLAVLIGVKELTKPLILALLRPFLPPALLRHDPSLVNKGKGRGTDGAPPRSEWEMAPAQVLAKYLNYFAVGAAVVYPIPLLWTTLGL